MAFLTNYWIVDIISILSVLISTILVFFKYKFSYWERRRIPFLTPKFPFGNIEDLAKQKENFGINVAKKYKELKKYGTPCGGFYMFSQPILILMDPDLIKNILIKDFSKFPDRGLYFNREADPMSANLFALRGQKWKDIRSMLTPTFTTGKMKMMLHILVKIGEDLQHVFAKQAAQNEIIGMKDMIARFTTDVIGSCAFGLECNSLKNPTMDFKKYGDRVLQTVLSNTTFTILGFIAPWFLKAFNLAQTDKKSSDFFMKILKDTIEYREKNEVHRNDFLDLFIRLKNNENISDEHFASDSKFVNKPNLNNEDKFLDLAPQAFVFFLAGFDTSATTSSVCLVELAQNINMQNKLREEIRTIMKKHNGEITYGGLSEMSYLDKVVQETLRKYPIAPNLVRICRENYKIPNTNTEIEAGTMSWISILGIHMDPEFYPEPEKFDPERFSEEEKAKRHPFTYLPFGDGPRNCIGMRFAVMQIKIALIALLKDYQFEICDKTEIPIKWSTRGILLFPANEIYLKVQKQL